MTQSHDEQPDTTPGTTAPDTEGDTTSDPALDSGASDWSGEGGAAPEGPATETDDASDEKA